MAKMAIAGGGSNASHIAFGRTGSGTFTITALRDSGVEGSFDLVLDSAAGHSSNRRGIYRLDF